MLAPQLVAPSRSRAPRPNSQTAAREATRRRKAEQLRRRYRDCVRIGCIFTAIVLSVVGYLVLITRSAALDDRLIAAQNMRAQLSEELVALEDRRATLDSRDRLSQIAARLGYHERPAMLIVDVPQPPVTVAPSRPWLAPVANLFHLQ